MHGVVQAIILGVLIGGVYALMASGLTLVFGIMVVLVYLATDVHTGDKEHWSADVYLDELRW